MNKIRDILNEIKHRNSLDISQTEIWYIHRGAPSDLKMITGDEITSIEKTFLHTQEAMIPHHRIIKIIHRGETLFDRARDT